MLKDIVCNWLLKGSPFVVFFLITNGLFAQSDNYWSWNFNTPSTLLAGAVVGGSAGPSAVFYNPSLIDHENVQSFSLSANIVSLQILKVDNIAGDGIDVDKIIFKVQPRFISYVLPNKNERVGLEVAILSPVSEEISYTIQHFDSIDIIKRTQGVETYSGYLKYSRKYDDTWAGFGASYKVSDNFYIGASSFLSVKLLKYQYRKIAQAYQSGDSVIIDNTLEPKYIALSSFEEEFKYWYLSFIFKAGAQYKSTNNQFSLGLNITFPDIPFIGGADIRKTFNRSNIFDNNSGSFTPNETIIEVEEKVKPRVKNPFSIAAGMQYFTKNRNNSFSLTIEYFHKIDSYAVAQSSVILDDIPDNLEGIIDNGDYLSYYFDAGSVTNIAVGFKQYFSEKFSVLGGFRTDFTVGNEDNIRFIGDKFKVNQIHLDKYHITVGPVVNFEKGFSIVTGLQYTLGRNTNMNQLVNYSDPVEFNPITNQALEGVRTDNAKAKFNELALFFGMTVDF